MEQDLDMSSFKELKELWSEETINNWKYIWTDKNERITKPRYVILELNEDKSANPSRFLNDYYRYVFQHFME